MEKAQRGEPQTRCRPGKAQQRDGGHHARGHQQQIERPRVLAHMAGRAVGDAEQPDCRHRQRRHSVSTSMPVAHRQQFSFAPGRKGKTESQPKTDYRQRTKVHSWTSTPQKARITASHCRRRKRSPRENHPQQNIHQRVDKVAEAGFQHMVVIHRPDEQQPVTADQHCRAPAEDLARGVFQPAFSPVATGG